MSERVIFCLTDKETGTGHRLSRRHWGFWFFLLGWRQHLSHSRAFLPEDTFELSLASGRVGFCSGISPKLMSFGPAYFWGLILIAE